MFFTDFIPYQSFFLAPSDSPLIDKARKMGICFGSENC